MRVTSHDLEEITMLRSYTKRSIRKIRAHAVQRISQISMSTEYSPSRSLTDTLQRFHITSPGKSRLYGDGSDGIGIGNNNNNNNNNNKFKDYVENNEFEESKFDTQLEEVQPPPKSAKSYISKLNDWSVNYGTVQQGKLNTQENEEPPQWKMYLKPEEKNQESTQTRNKQNSLSDLIVTTSLSDISLIPTNTFKRRNGNSKMLSDEITDDPAQEALGVFDNMLKHQKSANQPLLRGRDPTVVDIEDDGQSYQSSESSSSDTSYYHENDPSSISPSLKEHRTVYQGSTAVASQAPSGVAQSHNGLKLITPEDAGMIYNYVEGVWDKPPTHQDVSSRTLDSGTQSNVTNATTTETATVTSFEDEDDDESSLNKSVSFKLPKTKIDKKHESALQNEISEEFVDNTPLSTPRIDSKFTVTPTAPSENHQKKGKKSVVQRQLLNTAATGDLTTNMVGNVTDVSQVDTSFHLSKSAVVSALTDVIPHKESWDQMRHVDLSRKALESIVEMDELLPNVTTLNLQANKLNSLTGVPTKTMVLNCKENRLGSYCKLDHLVHLEEVDLSYNKLGNNLSIFSHCLHLKKVNVSHNSITSLHGLGQSRLLALDLSHNRLIGVLNFEQLVDHDEAWTYLEELDLCGNKLTGLKGLHLLSNLRVLKVDGNPIETIGGKNSRLRTLSARQNPALKDVTFESFPYLRILRVNGESLDIGEKGLPQTLEELEVVGGSRFSWDCVPPFLRKLSLRAAGIDRLPPGFIAWCPNLHTLSLRDNRLASVVGLVEQLPPHLQRLDLRGNPVTQFASDHDRRLFREAVMALLPELHRVVL